MKALRPFRLINQPRKKIFKLRSRRFPKKYPRQYVSKVCILSQFVQQTFQSQGSQYHRLGRTGLWRPQNNSRSGTQIPQRLSSHDFRPPKPSSQDHGPAPAHHPLLRPHWCQPLMGHPPWAAVWSNSSPSTFFARLDKFYISPSLPQPKRIHPPWITGANTCFLCLKVSKKHNATCIIFIPHRNPII